MCWLKNFNDAYVSNPCLGVWWFKSLYWEGLCQILMLSSVRHKSQFTALNISKCYSISVKVNRCLLYQKITQTREKNKLAFNQWANTMQVKIIYCSLSTPVSSLIVTPVSKAYSCIQSYLLYSVQTDSRIDSRFLTSVFVLLQLQAQCTTYTFR